MLIRHLAEGCSMKSILSQLCKFIPDTIEPKLRRVMYIFAIRAIGYQYGKFIGAVLGTIYVASNHAPAFLQFNRNVLLIDVIKRGVVDTMKVGANGVRHFERHRRHLRLYGMRSHNGEVLRVVDNTIFSFCCFI